MYSRTKMSALADEFRPFDVADPFAFYQRARSEATVFYSAELDYWVVPRYEDVLAILREPATFSSENAQRPFHPQPPAVERILGGLTAKSGLLGRNPPDHTRLRSFVNRAFTPRRVAVLEPQIREIAVRMIEPMTPRGRGDWVADLAYDLPALVIFLLLGIPDSDVPDVKAWAQSRVQLNFGNLPEADQVAHAENVLAYWQYCAALVEERFAQPGDDLPSDLVREYLRGDKSITKDEMTALVFGQLTAGHETTTGLLATGFLQLLRNRQQWEALCRDPELIPNAVEELLRFCTPVLAATRSCRPGPTCCCCWGRPTMTRPCFPAATAWTFAARASAGTWHSATGSTSASAHRWRASKRRWCWKSSPPGCRTRASSSRRRFRSRATRPSARRCGCWSSGTPENVRG
jgi:cytochrome P450